MKIIRFRRLIRPLIRPLIIGRFVGQFLTHPAEEGADYHEYNTSDTFRRLYADCPPGVRLICAKGMWDVTHLTGLFDV